MIEFLVSIWLFFTKPKPFKPYTIVQFGDGTYGAYKKIGFFKKDWAYSSYNETHIDFNSLDKLKEEISRFESEDRIHYQTTLLKYHRQKCLKNHWVKI